ncbi:MAG: glycosyltransferase family 10 [Hydrotalea sp.]|nr:glycosyltransferase family 10 [Hydrotalea sp.]
MARINILTIHQPAVACFLRQAPVHTMADDKMAAMWKGLRFVFNQKVEQSDIVVVYDYPPQNIKIEVASRRQVVLLVTEAFDRYPPEFVKQFGMVVSQHPKPADYDGTWVHHHGCLEWWYGVRRDHNPGQGQGQSQGQSQGQGQGQGGGDVKAQPTLDWQGLAYSPTKTNNRVSIITSTKNMPQIPGHAVRNRFVDGLAASDLPLDIFGQGRRPLQDKLDGLFHYPYHIALENSFIDDYWTEKLADGLLAECFIFYAGCRNIEKYFDKKSIVMLDINDPAGAIALIKKTMADNQWQNQQATIKTNKQKLMLEENIYPALLRLFVANGLLQVTQTAAA